MWLAQMRTCTCWLLGGGGCSATPFNPRLRPQPIGLPDYGRSPQFHRRRHRHHRRHHHHHWAPLRAPSAQHQSNATTQLVAYLVVCTLQPWPAGTALTAMTALLDCHRIGWLPLVTKSRYRDLPVLLADADDSNAQINVRLA